MPISDFRKKKLLYVFNVFFDEIAILDPKIEAGAMKQVIYRSGISPAPQEIYCQEIYYTLNVNQSGTIDRKDFELAIEKICSLRGWSQGSPQYKKTYDSMIQIWDGLRQKADANQDGQVSVEEWASMWDEYAKHPENALEWQNKYQRFMFDLEDASGDGTIDIEEFTSVCSCYGLEAQECRNAFQKISGGRKEVNFEQFQILWKQFFVSEDPSEPGNFIFGKAKF